MAQHNATEGSPSPVDGATAARVNAAPQGSGGGSKSAGAGERGRSTRSRISKRSSRSRRAPVEPQDMHVAAALIIAHNRARRIAATVRAARAIPGVDLVLVVDDASSDNTQELARKAGAVVVRHSHFRGRTASMETGASVIAMRDEPGRTPRSILLLPGSMGHHAVGAAPLVAAVTEHVADLAIARAEGEPRVEGASSKAARRAVEKATGWTPEEPLAPVRCLTREALEAAMPLARGSGLEVGMILDVLHAGFTVTEVECPLGHVPRSSTEGGGAAKLQRYRDVMLAISTRRVRGTLSSIGRTPVDTPPGPVSEPDPIRASAPDTDPTEPATTDPQPKDDQ
ncbi:glycosyltransferase family 2 protein [Demequina globuliformis]|uniref:glycosyltransferase family 2 protein n=1 Tax=Demequina globuliformis TaxID=676202 RepID=UPI001F367A90|nr:glycosyltransferase [Demequina globuliformis]